MILVTGGTGLVGSHLLYRLAVKNEKVRAIYRKNSDVAKVRQIFAFYTDNVESLFPTIEWVEADINDIPALEEAIAGIDYVYHCAAYISFNIKDDKKLRKINIEGTANLVNLSIENNIKKFCYVSSIATLGNNKNTDDLISENTSWNPEEKNNCYAISKYGAEMEVWRATQEGLKTIIVNPGVILGAGFLKNGSGKIFDLIQKGLNYYTEGITGFVDVEDVVVVMIKLMNSKTHNENFILISENWSFKKLFSTIASCLEKPLPKKRITPFLFKFIWLLDGLKTLISNKKRSITKSAMEVAFQKRNYSNEKIKKELDIDFKPIEQTIALICDRITEQP